MTDETRDETKDETRETVAAGSADEGWSAVEGVVNEEEGALVVGFLESEGIPARVVDQSAHILPTTNERLTPISVAVPTARVDEAVAVLSRRETAFASQKEGEETVLTDEGPAALDSLVEGEGSGR